MHSREKTGQAYGSVAKLLHWLVVGLLSVQYVIAWEMPSLRGVTVPHGLIALHLSLGEIVLLIALIRLIWRLVVGAPSEPPELPLWQRATATTLHWLLYSILLVMPLLGWANASSRGWVIDVFGTISLPELVAKGATAGHLSGDIHATLANALLYLVALHVAAALLHHFVQRDAVLLRMLPDRG